MENNKPDCANHPRDLFGETDMKLVADKIGDLHYKKLSALMKHLSQKLKQDSRKDWNAGRIHIAARLKEASIQIKSAYVQINEAWQISTPFMKGE